MAKNDADHGAANLKAVLSNQSSLSNLSDDQLGALGGSRDPIDSEDFSDADFGNDLDTESQGDDEPGDEGADDKDDEGDSEEGQDDEGDPEEGQDDEDEPAGEDDDEGEDEPAGEDDDEGDDEGEDEDEPTGEDDEDEPAGEDDDEGEDEDEDEPAGEDDEDDEDDAAKKKQRVPLERFREVNRRMREMERELKALKAERAAEEGNDPDNEEVPYDFDKAEAEYQDLVLDGKKEEATAKRREIRAAEQALFQKEADRTAGRHAEASHSKRELDALALQYERDYPAMDHNSDEFDPEINVEVEAAMLGYLQQKMDPVKAFKKALDKTVKLFDLKPRTAAKPKGKPEGDGKGKAKTGKPDAKKLANKAKAGKDKAAKAKKAPPDTTKVGDAGDGGKGGKPKLNVMDMSEEDFDALPKSTLARLRGDIL